MSEFQSFLCRAFVGSLLITFGSFSLAAQSTIFNIPSTDVLREKSIYFEGDFISHFDSYRNGGFQTYGYRMVYGIKRKFEVGANVFVTKTKNKIARELQPNVKWKNFENEKYGLAVSTGAIFFIPLNKPAGNRTYGMFYSNASKIVKKARGLRLTGGIYTVVGAKRDFGTKTGAIVGVEQPLFGKLTLVADWYSGKNRLGYSAAGFSHPITKRQFLFVGYNFGNVGRGNNAFSAFYGYTF